MMFHFLGGRGTASAQQQHNGCGCPGQGMMRKLEVAGVASGIASTQQWRFSDEWHLDLQDVMAKQESASKLAQQTLKIQRDLEAAAAQAQEEQKGREFEKFQEEVRKKNEVWRQRAEVSAAARRGDSTKAAKARKRQQELEEEAHHGAEVDADLFGEEDSSDAEYGAVEAAEDEAAAECALVSIPVLLLW
jgi:hypothetical protein